MRSTPAVVADLREMLTGGRVLVLSGAGISTDSGIPDYRDASGRRRHTAPMTYQRFVGSARARQRYWARSHIGWQRISRARPNAAHHAVTALLDAGSLSGVVTQNVDGLHTAAGCGGVIDLHGRLDAVICLGCGQRRPRLEIGWRLDVLNRGFLDTVAVDAVRPDGDVHLADEAVGGFRVPSCRRCGGVLKPDVVFFGEHVPRDRVQRALDLLSGSSALLVLGSSLVVGSGYRFVTAARRRDLPIAIINRGATRGDRHATIKVDGGLSEVLPRLVDGGRVAPPRVDASRMGDQLGRSSS